MKIVFINNVSNEKPHKDAVLENVVYIDRRTFTSLKEAEEKLDFSKRGRNHREEISHYGEGVARDLDEKAWIVEVKTLEELVNVMKDISGNLVFTDLYSGIDLGIYDDNR